MIRHIVLFQLKPFDNEDDKINKLEEIKTGLLALKNKIPELLSIEVGLNSNPNENFDIALDTTFESMKELEIYAQHPDHLAVGKILRQVLQSRSCVDFQL